MSRYGTGFDALGAKLGRECCTRLDAALAGAQLAAVAQLILAAFARFVFGRGHVIDEPAGIALHRRITRAYKRLQLILALAALGKEPRQHTPRPTRAQTTQRPKSVLPRRRGWGSAMFGHHATAYGSQLNHLLNQPETIALLRAAPARTRIAAAREDALAAGAAVESLDVRFEADPERGRRMSITAGDLHVDLSKNLVTDEILAALDDDVIAKGAGHLYGTSLPVGGVGTHAVLTSHTGMSNATLFDHLTQVGEGDLMYVDVYGETLAYQVDSIKVILPTEIDELHVVPGADLLTLFTCTPYAVNTHRLLVTGHRVPFDPVKAPVAASPLTSLLSLEPWMIGLIGGAVVALALIVVIVVREVRPQRDRSPRPSCAAGQVRNPPRRSRE